MSSLDFIPIDNSPFLYINDMRTGTTTNTTVVVGPGQCRDQFNQCDINVGNYLNANPNLTPDTSITINAAVNGINGLDTGSLAASKVYLIYAVANVLDASFTPGYVLSLAAPATGPLLPGNYNVYRHIGYVVTDSSSHFLLMNQLGSGNARTLMYQSQQLVQNAGVATAYTAIDLSAVVPAVENTPVYVVGYLTPNAAGDTLKLQAAGNTGDGAIIYGQVAAVVISDEYKIPARLASGVAKIAYKVSTASASAQINAAGFDYFI